jgi:hypothetical protein
VNPLTGFASLQTLSIPKESLTYRVSSVYSKITRKLLLQQLFR